MIARAGTTLPRLSAYFVRGPRLYLRRRENEPSPTSVQSLQMRAFRGAPCGWSNPERALEPALDRVPQGGCSPLGSCSGFQDFPASRDVAKRTENERKVLH